MLAFKRQRTLLLVLGLVSGASWGQQSPSVTLQVAPKDLSIAAGERRQVVVIATVTGSPVRKLELRARPEPGTHVAISKSARLPEGDLLYHTSRGRAVWFPSSFTEKRPFIRSSGCYHRNLTLLHLQTEALLQALAVHRDVLDKGVKVPDLLVEIAKDAVQQLSSLYSSDDASYRSSSVRAYLDETPSQKKLVNTTLGNYGLDALKYELRPT